MQSDKQVTFVDCRTEAEFAEGHIPGDNPNLKPLIRIPSEPGPLITKSWTVRARGFVESVLDMHGIDEGGHTLEGI
jgi:rhodanese-related sulfurtransferase